jgi:hypothetical protein
MLAVLRPESADLAVASVVDRISADPLVTAPKLRADAPGVVKEQVGRTVAVTMTSVLMPSAPAFRVAAVATGPMAASTALRPRVSPVRAEARKEGKRVIGRAFEEEEWKVTTGPY